MLMRYCRPLLLATCLALLGILIAIFANLLLPVTQAQATPALPKSWSDAVVRLADKIAATLSPSTPLRLEVKNISSLDTPYASAVELALENELRRHSFHLVSAGSSAAGLPLTLSESVDRFVWVVQYSNNATDPQSSMAAIVAVPKADLADGQADEPLLSLEKRLVWKQSGKFLDFALLESPSGGPWLLVLDTNQLALYKMSGSEWKISRTNPIPQTPSPSRDPQGKIRVKEGYVSMADQQCTGEPDLAGDLRCAVPKAPPYIDSPAMQISFPKGLGTSFSGECHNEHLFLYSGEGDWTQPDLIQGYLPRDLLLPVVPSGSAIQFGGPIINLQADSEANSARAVVHNLKTGNYEAYIVTATCSH
jgi:hypothetical protein